MERVRLAHTRTDLGYVFRLVGPTLASLVGLMVRWARPRRLNYWRPYRGSWTDVLVLLFLKDFFLFFMPYRASRY